MTCILIPNGVLCVDVGMSGTIVVGGKTLQYEIEKWNGCPWILDKQGNPDRLPTEAEMDAINKQRGQTEKR